MDNIICALLQQRCFASAAVYCEFWMSSLQSSAAATAAAAAAAAQNLELDLRLAHSLAGDAFCGLRQTRRAIAHYERALLHRTSAVAAASSHSAAALQIKIAECALVAADECDCGGGGGNEAVARSADALTALESIPLRSLPVHLLLARARLQEECGRLVDAAQTLSTALSAAPHCIEAALSLMRLSAQHTPGASQAPPPVEVQRVVAVYATLVQQHPHVSLAWTARLVEVHAAFARYQHRAALDILAELDAAHPQCCAVLTLTAEAQVQLSDTDLARSTLERVRVIDPYCVDSMDTFAFALRARCDTPALVALTRALAVVGAPGRAEPHLAAALHADALGDRDKAIELCKRACSIAPHNGRAHAIHGFLLLGSAAGFGSSAATPQYEAALTEYRRAYAIDKRDLNVFQGLVDAHLGAARFKDALFASKEALQRAPRNPKALVLVGSVLGHSVEGREKARAAFAKALALDSHCLDAVFAAAKLDATERKFDAALQLLTRHLGQHNREYLHTKIANVYAMMEDAARAAYHFQAALSLNPNYAPAIAGMERLEGGLKENEGSVEFDADEYEDEED